jgi:hypothetical protein
MPLRQVVGVLTAARYRELAAACRTQANEIGISSTRAAILRNIAHSFVGLASQLEMLAASVEKERSQSGCRREIERAMNGTGK